MVEVPEMVRRGSEEEGFTVRFDEESGAIHVRAWGFWSPETAAQFAPTVIDTCRSSQHRKSLVLDVAGLRPQREFGQLAFGALMTALPELGVLRASVTADSSLTRLQLLRIATECGVRRMVHFHLQV